MDLQSGVETVWPRFSPDGVIESWLNAVSQTNFFFSPANDRCVLFSSCMFYNLDDSEIKRLTRNMSYNYRHADGKIVFLLIFMVIFVKLGDSSMFRPFLINIYRKVRHQSHLFKIHASIAWINIIIIFSGQRITLQVRDRWYIETFSACWLIGTSRTPINLLACICMLNPRIGHRERKHD